jgi:glycine oxidase
VRLRTDGNRIDAVECQDGFSHVAGQYLFAAGAWTDQLLECIGVSIGVKPVKGQIVLYRPIRPLLRRIIGFDKRYLVPRGDGRILVGSTEEPEAGFDKQSTVAGVDGLKSFAMEIVPELASAEVEKTWAGLRPGSPDDLPFLGRLPNLDNAFIATGHYRAGIQLSVATAQIMSETLQNRQTRIDLDAFRVDRVPTTPLPMAFRS